MAWMDKHPDATGTVYYLPPTGTLTHILRYLDGDITEGGK